MKKILDLALDFETKSKEQANDIERSLKSEFSRHEKHIIRALKNSESEISNAINDQTSSLKKLIIPNWLWGIGFVMSVILVSWGVTWYQGILIVDNWVTISQQKEQIKQLESKGGNLQFSQCGDRLCLAQAKGTTEWTRNSDKRPMFIPEGY
ncbi:MbeB family mobilization protein [Aliivibrio fischeri]|uniref:MbeB family mobilization protein n=1 Tax=Aliivibrio fischeri TaxID=668 RepID=UPI00128FD6C5